MARFALGYRPDPEDQRDFALSALRMPEPPASHSLKQHVVDIPNQNPLGSCVANAVPQALRMVQHAAGNPDAELCSRLFAYWHARNQHGDTGSDSGTYIRTCIKVLNALGRPPERAWPYKVDDLDEEEPTFTKKPPSIALMHAFDRKQAEYRRVWEDGSDRVLAVKRAIASGRPVVFGTDLGASFEDYSDGLIQPPLDEPIIGGHAMCIVGYDGASVEVVNSWGEGWGNGGYCRLSWAYVMWQRTRDLWVISV